VASKLHWWLSVSGIVTPLKNGSLKAFGSFQRDLVVVE
jgi:hypothetical protein